MRYKFLTIATAILLSISLQAQTFWSVDFETSDNTPADWTVINHNDPEDGQWVFNNPDNRDFFSAKADNGFAIIDGDYYGSGKHQNTDLISPEIALSNHSNFKITFDHHFRKAYGTGDTCRFSAKINDGEWTLIKMWASETVEETFECSLSDSLTFAENDLIQLKFNYVGSYDYYWSLDNIKLFEPSAMVLSEALQTSTNNTYGMISGKILMSKLQVNTDGALSPISSLNISGDIGSTEVASDLEKVMIYKGESPSVIDDEGAKMDEVNISGNTFELNINETLEAVNNYYLVYQLSATANENDSIDLAINSVTANAQTIAPDVVNLPGMKYVRAGMQGTYTISNNAASTPDYTNFDDAIADLNTVGVQNNVVFEIEAGTYDGFITLGEISGVAENKTITFKGMGSGPDATILTSNAGYNNDKATIILNNAKYIRFDNLTVTSSSTSNATLVRLENTYKDIAFNQIKFIGIEVTSTSFSNNKHLVYDKSTDDIDEKLSFDGCEFINGYIALYLQGQNNVNPFDQDISIKNSNFTGQYSKSVYITLTENVEISHNTFENSKDLRSNFTNIDLYRCNNGVNIDANIITNTLDEENFLGIVCRPCIGTEDNPIVISNNMIRGTTNSTSFSHAIDIKFNGSEYINILNNTIYLESTSSSLNGIFVEVKAEHLRIENNLIANTSSEGMLMWIKKKNIENKTIDYNRYECASSIFGKYKSDEITTFSAWKDSLNQETHSDSLSLSNLFVSESNLHISSDEGLRVANPLSLVPTDIDGETRSLTTPCAGADEFASNTPPYLETAFDTLTFNSFPESQSVNLLHHFADAENDSITISVKMVSNDANLSAEIVNDSILNVTRLSAVEALTEWVQLQVSSNGDTITQKIFAEMISVDQAPIIQNQIEAQNFDAYPQTITVDITGAFTDPDNEDADMTYELVNTSDKYATTLNGMSLELERQTPNAFSNETFVLKANNNGKSVEMTIEVNATAVIIEPLVADFEEMTLGTDSIWEAPQTGENYFTDKTWRFYNFTESFYWGGYQVSSRKDTSAQGMDAQYTAITGSGYNGSDNYCVAYPNYYQSDVFPETGSATETVKGVYVTNNVWTYQAIINGDAFASAFGGASGDEPDYFRIRAVGYNENDEASDTAYFYLADYRFEDNTQDYVVTDWQYFDLSVLGAVSKIRFSVEGTKTNDYGLVTPAYFCMDNFNDDAPVAVDLAPIVTNTTSVHLLESDNEATVNLLDLVTDPDNEDSEIVFSIESGDNTDVADFNITDSILTVTRTEGNHGNTTLNIQATSNGLSVNFEIPVTVDMVTGIENIESMNVSCYPNPCSDYIYINNTENANYQIISTNGAVVSEGKVLSNENFRINTGRIKSGVYQLMIVTPSQVKTLKLIRQ